jgi:hypothetical protein
MTNRITLITLMVAVTLTTVPVANTAMSAEDQENELLLVSGILLKLDLQNRRGLLTTDLGRPIYFEVPKAYLFENVTVGARISLRLDEDGRALKVMDTSIPDLMGVPGQSAVQPVATSVEDPISR